MFSVSSLSTLTGMFLQKSKEVHHDEKRILNHIVHYHQIYGRTFAGHIATDQVIKEDREANIRTPSASLRYFRDR